MDVPRLATSDCLDEATILACVTNADTPSDRLRIDAHLQHCAACAEVLAFARLAITANTPSDGAVDRHGASRAAYSPAASANRQARPHQRYQLGPELARGGMGRIVLARDVVLQREVALKLPLDDTPGLRGRFAREVDLIGQFEHPAIVTVHDAGEFDDGTPYYAMRLVGGQTLDDRVARLASPQERLALVPALLAVADALAYVHHRGIVHRDVKPANIVLGEFGETVLLDWGLAKIFATSAADATLAAAHAPTQSSLTPSAAANPNHATTATPSAALTQGAAAAAVRATGFTSADPESAREQATAFGTAVGTPAYMAPEQARGAPATPAVDVYALGATLFHVLTGRPPVDRNATALASAPADITAIVRCAMAPSPADRYVDAKGFADDLRRFLNGKLVQAHAYSMAEHAKRWIQRNRTAVVTGAVLLTLTVIAIVVGVTNTITERNHAVAAQAIAERERNGAQELVSYVLSDLSAELNRVGRIELVAEPSQRVIAYYQRFDERTRQQPRNALHLVTSYFDVAQVASEQGKDQDALTALAHGERALQHAPPLAQAPWQCDYDLIRATSLRRLGKGSAGDTIGLHCAERSLRASWMFPYDTHWRRVAIWANAYATKTYFTSLNSQAALTAGDRALALLARAGAAAHTRELAVARVLIWHDRATWATENFQWERAREYSQQLLTTAQQFVSDSKGDVQATSTLSAAWNIAGRIAEHDDNLDEAERAYHIAAKAAAQAIALAPHEIGYRRNASVQTESLARIALARNQPDQALALYQQSRDESAAIAAMAPDNIDVLSELGIAELALGDLLSERKSTHATAAFERAIAAFGKAMRLAPDRAHYRASQSLAYGHLADHYAKQQQRAAAREAIEACVAGSRAVLAMAPTSEAQIALAQFLFSRAGIMPEGARKDAAEAQSLIAAFRGRAAEDNYLRELFTEIDALARRVGAAK